MKQGHYRVGTNQTSISNKKQSKSKIQSSNNRNIDNIHSQSFQLPKIHRVSNNQTGSNRSYDLSLTAQQKVTLNQHQKLSNIEQSDKQQMIGVVDYEKMTMQQIKREYERLRKQFNILNTQIRRSQEMILSRVTNKKSRVSSTGETQKLLAKTQLQIYQNSLLIQKLRLQCQQLDKRSSLANSNISKPNAELNQKLVKVKQKLLLTKQKIKLLKKKTKKSGEDILNVQDVHELVEKLEKENKNYQLKLSSLEARLQESRYKMQRQDQKLLQIQNSYNEAQNYLKLFRLQNEQQAQRGLVQKQYQQLKYKHQVIKKKIQSDQQTNMQKYHQLLKLLQTESEKQESLGKKLIQEDVNILKARNILLELEQQLQHLEGVIDKFKQQQFIKKQAYMLRKAIQSANIISDSITPSPILEENESQMNDTIEAARQNCTIQDDKKSDYQNVNQQLIEKRKNDQLVKAASIVSGNIKKQQSSSGNIDIKSGRKIHSVVIQTKQQSYSNIKLKQLPLSNNNVNAADNMNIQSENQGDGVSGSKIPSIDQLQQRNSGKMTPLVMKNQSLRNNNHNNKSSLSNNNNDDINNDEFIRQLERLNQQLIRQTDGDSSSNQQQLNTKATKQIITKASQQSSTIPSKQKISPRGPYSIVSPKNRVELINKQGRIRKQHSKILKPEMLQQIDKTNIEYSKKILQLKKQIQVEQIVNVRNKEDRYQLKQQQQQHQNQQQQQQQQQLHQPQQQPQQHIQSEHFSDSDLDQDIDNDIQEINNMVKQKLDQ